MWAHPKIKGWYQRSGRNLKSAFCLPHFNAFTVKYPHRYFQFLRYKGDRRLPTLTSKLSKHLLLSHSTMRSFNNINSLAVAAVAFIVLCMAPSQARADIITYTGDECAGKASVDFPCDGICRSFANQRSFKVGTGPKTPPFSNRNSHNTLPD
jgi:hypothetical protein